MSMNRLFLRIRHYCGFPRVSTVMCRLVKMHRSAAISMAVRAISWRCHGRMVQQCRRCSLGIRAAGADGDQIAVRLDDFAFAADNQNGSCVRHQESRLQAAQITVGPPVLGHLDCGLAQVAAVAIQFASNLSKSAGRRRPRRQSRPRPCLGAAGAPCAPYASPRCRPWSSARRRPEQPDHCA